MSHEKAPAALAGGAGQEQPKAPQSSGSAGGATSPDRAAILDFLRLWPHGEHVALTAIAPDRRAIETRSFRPGALEAAADWAAEQNAAKGRNVYFATAQLLRPVAKKAAREDVAAVPALLVDIDCRAGEPVAEELRRIADLLADEAELRRRGLPGLPTLVVCSGGGYWAFWFLAEPAEVGGDLARAEAVAARNLAIAQALDGDACHNVDRIARLPGTVNRPDAKKRAKGRTEALAHVAAHDPSRVYELAQFPETRAATAPASVGDHVERVAGMDDPRLARVSDRAKVVIVHGHDPEEPDRHPSRSEWLFFVCCEMVRAGCDDETIYAVITDPSWAVSASVLESTDPDRYARRQVERARDQVMQPELLEMNDRYAVIQNWGGRCRVAEEVYEEGLGRYKLTRLSFEDVRNAHSNRFVAETGGNDKTTLTPLGKWWLQHPRRRQYRTLAFNPKGTPPDVYNLWRGFAVPALPGDWSRLHRHIVEVLAAGNASYAEWIVRWAAWLVQNPDQPAEVALVFRGGQGTGKGTFARALCDLLGQHAMHVSRASHVSGKFNAHLRDCVLLYADEVTATTDRDAIGEIKRLVTEPTLVIEPKGLDSEVAPNRLHVVMTSNEEWVVPMDDDDRRFVVFDVDPCRKEDRAWFAAIHRELAEGGLSAFLHDLLAMDLGDWHPRHDRPVTPAMNEQKAASLRGAEAAWFELLTRGELPSGEAEADGGYRVTSSALLEWMRHFRPRDDIKHNHLSALLGQPQSNHRQHRAGMGFAKTRRGRGTPTQWVIPPLPEARARWDERRFPAAWPDEEQWVVQISPF